MLYKFIFICYYELVGLEALLRWNHSTKGLLTPDKFLDNIYMHGFMKDIDKFVINRAKKDLQILRNNGYNHSISINVSVSNPVDCNLEDLEIEITEIEMVVDREIVSKYLKSIPNKILLDDFGTGFSSLQYLQDFKIDTLKIDRAFISSIPRNTVVLETIIMLARMLNIDLIAEGVETKEQLDWCKAHNVYVIQGFYYDKPESLNYVINKYLS